MPNEPDQRQSLHPDDVPGLVVRLDTDATVRYLNAGARAALDGVEAGHSWLDLWPGVDATAWRALLDDGSPVRHDGTANDRAFSFTVVHDDAADGLVAYGTDVTALENALRAAALQAVELREMASFPEMNPGPVFRLDLAGVILRANAAARRVFGGDVIGRPWREIVPTFEDEAWRQVVDEGARLGTELEVGGTWLAFTVARAPDGAYAFVYGADVTALKAAERRLEEMARFPDMNPGPVLRLDAQGEILLANRAARELFARNDLTGIRWTDICPGVDHALLETVRSSVEAVPHEAEVGGRIMLFTHRAGFGKEQVFVYGADLTDLKEAERALHQSERMATLGTLAAGVAHELNNPSAAVQRAAEHLAAVMGDLQAGQLALNRLDLPLASLDAMAELDAEARRRAASPPDFDPVARSDREQDVEFWLEDRDVDEGWDLAPSLVALGYGPSELDALADAFDPEHVAPVVTWMSRTYPVYAVLEEIRHGAARISEIVTALKAYSYVDRAPVQAVDVNEGIRHTLIILQNKLKRGVTVELDLDPELPKIEAYGGDLNQVWTNLIDNAVDAMGGEGRLVVRSRPEVDGVRVEIEDDGPGIPAEIQGRVFDPFFTTKAPGDGTGLGLNTTFTIVSKKHGGRIELRSRPGRTCFVVRLGHELKSSPSPATAHGARDTP